MHRIDFINSSKVFTSYAWHDFHYENFKQVSTDFSKNKLPGAAPNAVVAGLDITSKAGCYINITYNYTDKIALNDANSAYASSYNLLGTRLGYRKDFKGKIGAEIFAGAENIFDTKYSLGNDINAAAGRYYNAAPGRNYYAGIVFNFIKNNNPAFASRCLYQFKTENLFLNSKKFASTFAAVIGSILNNYLERIKREAGVIPALSP